MIPGDPTPQRGSALAVVLWTLVALGMLSLMASIGARLDLALGAAHRDHATALAAAEAGLAEGLAALAAAPDAPDSAAGTIGAARWEAAWSPPAPGVAVLRASGTFGGAARSIRAIVRVEPAGIRVVAWREEW